MACWLLEFETKKLDNKAINLIENLNNFQAISYSESNNIFEYKVYLNKYVTEEIFLNLIFNNSSTENYKLKKKIKIIRKKIESNLPTIPSVLGEELECNIFLRAKDIESFSKLRDLKDNF